MNEGKMFGNQGSPEQIKIAEERMSPTEKKASDTREEYLAKWKEAGIDGELYRSDYDFGHPNPKTISGTVNGHKISIDADGDGYIDNRKMTDKQSNALYQKYKDFTAPLKDTESARQDIQDTFNTQQKEEKNKQETEANRLEEEKTQILVDELLGTSKEEQEQNNEFLGKIQTIIKKAEDMIVGKESSLGKNLDLGYPVRELKEKGELDFIYNNIELFKNNKEVMMFLLVGDAEKLYNSTYLSDALLRDKDVFRRAIKWYDNGEINRNKRQVFLVINNADPSLLRDKEVIDALKVAYGDDESSRFNEVYRSKGITDIKF